jgi:hypothetical protein
VDPRLEGFVELLVSMGLCTKPKRDALLEYPRAARVVFSDRMMDIANVSKLHLPKLLLLGLNHIKAVIEPGKPLFVKAYLRNGYYWGLKNPSHIGPVTVSDALPY